MTENKADSVLGNVGELIDNAQRELLAEATGSKLALCAEITKAEGYEISTSLGLEGTGIFDKKSIDDDDAFKLFARLCVMTHCFQKMQDALVQKINELDEMKSRIATGYATAYARKLKAGNEQAFKVEVKNG